MPTVSPDAKPLETIETNAERQRSLVVECEKHEQDSYSMLSTIRKDWDNKESILLGYKAEDQLSKKAKSKIVDQSLSSMIMERASRVCANLPVVETFAESKNSVGRSMLMNIALNRFQEKANEEGSHLLKLRHFDVYSHVYGSMFGLVPWRVNNLTNYVGPELLPLNMRDIRPQPGRRTIDKMDQFGVRGKVSLNWLKQQDTDTWMNIDSVIAEYKSRKDAGASSRATSQDTRTYTERMRYPTQKGDEVFPDIEIFTEYRHDKWITWAPRAINNKDSKSWILRIVENPYPKGLLPIVVKHAFPLMDSIIGLGDIERGKTLQFAKNSLINLYFDGVKMALFPPLHVNLNEVDPASIKWGAGEKWYMEHPNESVQMMAMRSSEWLQTFQSTFGFLTTSIQNLSGSTTINETPGAEPTLGKTPDAIKQYAGNQNARDNWDTFMMEDFIKQVYERWVALIADKMEVEQTFKIWGPEIQELQREYKDEDIMDIFKQGGGASKGRGVVTFNKNHLHETDKSGKITKDITYSLDIEAGSMAQSNKTDENQAASEMLQEFAKEPTLYQTIKAQGGDINFIELYKRRMIGGGIKDWDKILTEPPTNPATEGVDPTADLTTKLGLQAAPEVPGAIQSAGAPGGQPVEQPVAPGATPAPAPAMSAPPTAPGAPVDPNAVAVAPPTGAPGGDIGTTQNPKEAIDIKIPYDKAPPDVQRQLEQKAGLNPSKMTSPAEVISNAAQDQGAVPQVVQDPSLPVDANGIRDPHIAAKLSEVLGGISGIPPTTVPTQ